MNRKSIPIPAPIAQLQRQLDQFRRAQPRRAKLPESLWQAAVELARQHGVYSVAHPLRLDYMGLKKRLGGIPSLRRKATRHTFAARPGRLTGFLVVAPAPGRRLRCARCSDSSSCTLAGFGGGARRLAPSSGHGSGTCPRSVACIPGRARADHCLPGPALRSVAAEASRTVDRWLDRLGLADRAGDRLDALSHGNQQRVQLIAALVNEPDLLVLDEPFAGLDPIAIGNIGELLAEIARAGATVLFSSHQLDLVEDLCEDVVIIDQGRVVLVGRLTELRAAVPQRFLDIRYRGVPPDWSALVWWSSSSRRPGTPDCASTRRSITAVIACSFGGRPRSSRSRTGRRRCQLFRQAVAA